MQFLLGVVYRGEDLRFIVQEFFGFNFRPWGLQKD